MVGNNAGGPSFGHISGAGKSSLRARDAGAGRNPTGRKLLNRGITGQRNQNYIQRDDVLGKATSSHAADLRNKTENHELAAKMGFELFTDGPDRLGWLLNMNSVRDLTPFQFTLCFYFL